jgi:protein-L-isoaspartate(D-aspartate) O-methyltransferase
MVRQQLMARGIGDRRVLAAMASVPRHQFVPEHLFHQAYDDGPLPIGHEQTISQPFIVALMTLEAKVDRRSRVLDIGTGTGYQAAVLAKIASHVWTMERLVELACEAESRLQSLGIANVSVAVGDGAVGLSEQAPYDAIVVAAAAPHPPPRLLDQLAPGGRLVIPIGNRALQELTVIERRTDGLHTRLAGGCRFVPLVSPEAFEGREGWGRLEKDRGG